MCFGKDFCLLLFLNDQLPLKSIKFCSIIVSIFYKVSSKSKSCYTLLRIREGSHEYQSRLKEFAINPLITVSEEGSPASSYWMNHRFRNFDSVILIVAYQQIEFQ